MPEMTFEAIVNLLEEPLKDAKLTTSKAVLRDLADFTSMSILGVFSTIIFCELSHLQNLQNYRKLLI